MVADEFCRILYFLSLWWSVIGSHHHHHIWKTLIHRCRTTLVLKKRKTLFPSRSLMSSRTFAWSPTAGGMAPVFHISHGYFWVTKKRVYWIRQCVPGIVGKKSKCVTCICIMVSKWTVIAAMFNKGITLVFGYWYSKVPKTGLAYKCLKHNKGKNGSHFNETGSYCGDTSFILPFVNFSKVNRPESVSWWLLRFIGSWYMNKRLSWLREKKGKKGNRWGVAGPPDLCDRRRVIPHFVMFN